MLLGTGKKTIACEAFSQVETSIVPTIFSGTTCKSPMVSDVLSFFEELYLKH